VKCVSHGAPIFGSIFGSFEVIAEDACKKVANDPLFKGEFNVVGLSQGGLIARYITESCDMPGKVRNLLTVAGPHMGVDSAARCSSGVLCNISNKILKSIVYDGFAQNNVAPAGYWRDPNNFITYETKNVFLPALNNEHPSPSDFSKLRASRFSQINAGMFVMFTEDMVIWPRETAHFQPLAADGTVMKLEDSDFYKKDYIGLRALNEAGKITFTSLPGDHLEFTTKDITDTFIPFLLK